MIDYSFAATMFAKYTKHLQDVVESIETMVGGYDSQLDALNKLDPKKYGWRVKELEGKKAEAFKKLAQISPNIEKMGEQLGEIQAIINSDIGHIKA